jgi:hypothetical protein
MLDTPVSDSFWTVCVEAIGDFLVTGCQTRCVLRMRTVGKSPVGYKGEIPISATNCDGRTGMGPG